MRQVIDRYKEMDYTFGSSRECKLLEDFWNTINGSKVNLNILVDKDVYVVSDGVCDLVVIHVPRADYKLRPIFLNGNPYSGTYKRNHAGC